MPIVCHMTWVPSTKRWAKNHKGRSYSVSCRQLRCQPTKESSCKRANAWWESKEKELDEEIVPPPHLHAELLGLLSQRREWAIRHGQTELAEKLDGQIKLIENSSEFDEPDDPDADDIKQNIQIAELFGIRVPPDLDPSMASHLFGQHRVWQDRLGRDSADSVPTERTVAAQVHGWLGVKRAEVSGGLIDESRYDAYRATLAIFRDWLGAANLIDIITAPKLEQFHVHLLHRNAERAAWEQCPSPPRKGERKPGYSPDYAKSVFGTAKSFISWLAEHGTISRPENFRKKFRFATGPKKILTFEVQEVRALLDACDGVTGRTKLYLLLMLNCGMYQSDISDLGCDEVDWDKGVIERPRSKTPRGPKAKYKLWPETFRLLQKYRNSDRTILNKHGAVRVLATRKGRPLVLKRLKVDAAGKEKLSRSDSIKSAYRRLCDRLGVEKPKPPKLVRKTSSSLLAMHPLYKFYAQHFLAQSPRTVADKHYVIPSDAEFFTALAWLRTQYGLGTKRKRRGSKSA
jgi:integrase